MATALLTTKFFIPPSAPDRVDRQRLFQRLDAGLQPACALILVCAPAGYGKTSLLADWATACSAKGLKIAWLSLEPPDNDPVRFFTYLAGALEPAAPGVSALLEDYLAAPQLPAAADLCAALVNLLAQRAEPLVLVLDDFQVIHDQNLHAAISFLVEHLPPGVHLALSSRSDPPLLLHRLRARGQLVELRLDDLRFDHAETGQLLSQSAGGRLAEEDIRLLEERTEGWPAGLRMVLLSIRDRSNLHDFLAHFSGSNRYILDYLAEEVFHNQSEAMQTFMLHSALLDRLCAPLCNALTGQSNAAEMLDALERANCFLIPLDENRTWYRFHHLFADLLRMRLKQRGLQQAGLEEELHRRAAAWLDGQGYYEEAVQHSIQAGDYERAAQIVESRTLDLFARGRLHQLLSWIRLLPEELTVQRPWLNIYQAWALAFAARLDEARPLLARAQGVLQAGGLPTQEQARMQCELHAIQSLISVTSGNVPAAIALTTQPDNLVPADAGFARSVQVWAVGYALRMMNNLDRARACFEEALRIGFALDNLWTIASVSGDLGTVLRQQGDLQKAEEVFRAGLARAHQVAGGPGYAGRVEAFLANLLIERGRLAEADALIDQAVEHNRRWENPNHCAFAWMVRARLALIQNKLAVATAALAQADAWVERGPVVPNLRAAISGVWMRYWLHTGALNRAIGWADGQAFGAPDERAPMGEVEETLRLAAARALLAAGQMKSVRELLAPVESATRAAGKLSPLVETLVLQARAALSPSSAAAILKEALQLGLPRGFRQVYLDEGQRLIPLLEDCQEIAGVSELLAHLRAASSLPPAEHNLTEREVEILRWVASGLSNPEIGARLFITANTVKAHTATIYRKLDVANRAEAIAKAKDLGLL